MRVLFLHNNFPAQYRHIAAHLGQDPQHKAVYITRREQYQIPGVTKLILKPSRAAGQQTHHYIRPLEDSVLHGQAAARIGMALRQQGFIPDVIVAHVGWGPGMFMKDIFPESAHLGHFEWFYQRHNSNNDFLPEDKNRPLDDYLRLRMFNVNILPELLSCDWGYVPTAYQRAQFPTEFQSKLSLLHEGVDTEFFCPDPAARMPIDLPADAEVVTYGTRGMEPYRGFPQFMRSLPRLLAKRPKAHIVIMGEDRVAYGTPLPSEQSWKKIMLAELEGKLDMNRVHFTGPLRYADYVRVLQASHLHVYLTIPFVLSWSLIEAMACGALILASDTPPVREAMDHDVHGWLSDFFDHEAMADRMDEMLGQGAALDRLRRAARERALARYALKDQLPRFYQLLEDLAARRLPPRASLA